MALKIFHSLCVVFWLSLLLLVFHELCNFKPTINSTEDQINSISKSSAFSYRPFLNRKAAAWKFDFAPFQKHHQQTMPEEKEHRERAQSEIDPRYGVEKRLVPTGPNPLHH
ncbi:CLAVATA3/ESR (CLE)-RELATED PROTEIN 13 [Salix purpurea]|uniref:CLAVATA3/ESR (CLE)-RELATED PROTEIN 13 n=1 Tax=Salix purpurea TaxID=77065 RepID=A0A9Q0TVS3_SALPP|nr:CLAVATA3/ESR (CLE)-RELATED PROTEIN 13 [Salix purpurea]